MDVKERFLKYVTYYTTSDEDSETVPSTARQRVLGQALAEELAALGLQNVELDGFGYVYGVLPASPGCEDLPALGFIAHMDTAPGVSGENVKPRCLRYEGGDIELGNGEALRVKDFPNLEKYIGQELIVTDGTTLLGADDKAGVAEIVSACAYLLAHPEVTHRQIAVCFTPDEEIGRGPDHFDFAKFPAKQAYTVDGGEIGELEYENFNASSARITVHGVGVHPGSAKNLMVNAAAIAAEYQCLLPQAMTPEHTQDYEGFIHLDEMQGTVTEANLKYILRDHNLEKLHQKEELMRVTGDFLNAKYGIGTVEVDIRSSYYNMREKIAPHMHLIRTAADAFRAYGIEPVTQPIRGGTDGARLTFMGLPCPNLGTGGFQFHGIYEFIPVRSLELMPKILCNIVYTYGKGENQ